MNKWERIATIGAILSIICSIGFVYVSALTQYQVAKPLMMSFIAVPPSLKTEGFTFQTDLASKRWTAMVVYLINTGGRAMGVDGVIVVYDGMYREIARGGGTSSLVLPEAQGSLTITIDWIPGASILDATSFDVNLQEFDGEPPATG